MNCLIIDGDQNSSKPLEKVIKKSPHLKLIANCSTALQATNVFVNNRIDVIFIDGHVKLIESDALMQYVDKHKPHVIAISSVTELGKVHYDLKIEDFMLKPISKVQLSRIINKIILSETLDSEGAESETFIFIKVNRAFLKIPTSQIAYVQALSDYVRIHAEGKVYTTYSTMKEMHAKLPESDFVRIHRSYIAKVDSIVQVQDGFVMVDQKLLPVGKKYKQQLLERLNIIG